MNKKLDSKGLDKGKTPIDELPRAYQRNSRQIEHQAKPRRLGSKSQRIEDLEQSFNQRNIACAQLHTNNLDLKRKLEAINNGQALAEEKDSLPNAYLENENQSTTIIPSKSEYIKELELLLNQRDLEYAQLNAENLNLHALLAEQEPEQTNRPIDDAFDIEEQLNQFNLKEFLTNNNQEPGMKLNKIQQYLHNFTKTNTRELMLVIILLIFFFNI